MRAGPAMIAPPITEDVDGNDFFRLSVTGMQGGIVRDTQVTAKPMEGNFHREDTTRRREAVQKKRGRLRDPFPTNNEMMSFK